MTVADGGAPVDGANATTAENSDGAELAANVLGSVPSDRNKSVGVEVGIGEFYFLIFSVTELGRMVT